MDRIRKIPGKINLGVALLVVITIFFLAIIADTLIYNLKEKNAPSEEPVYEESYTGDTISVYGKYLVNSKGKVVDVKNASGPSYNTFSGGNPLVYTDYFQTKALVLAGDKLYLYDSDLNSTYIGSYINKAGMSLTGNRVFYTTTRGLFIYDVATGEVKEILDNIYDAALSPNGQYLLYHDDSDDCLYSMNLENNKIRNVCNKYHLQPLAISDDGKDVFGCRLSDNRYKIYYVRGNDIHSFGYTMSYYDYDFVILSKDMADILCYINQLSFYHTGEDNFSLRDFMGDNKVYIPMDYTVYEHNGRSVICLSNSGFGGFCYTFNNKIRCIADNHQRVTLFSSTDHLQFAGYQDGVFTAYAMRGYTIDKATISYEEKEDGELKAVAEHEKFLPDYSIRILKTNAKQNHFYFLTTDYKIYCYDGNNDEIKYICSIEKEYTDNGNLMVYSRFDDKLYFRDGSNLFCYDPYSEKISLVTGNCMAIRGIDSRTAMVNVYQESMEDEIFAVNGQLFVPSKY